MKDDYWPLMPNAHLVAIEDIPDWIEDRASMPWPEKLGPLVGGLYFSDAKADAKTYIGSFSGYLWSATTSTFLPPTPRATHVVFIQGEEVEFGKIVGALQRALGAS